MDRRMSQDLDNWITGHYGEDQFRNEDHEISPEFDEGVKARKDGISIEFCPYMFGDRRTDWRYGWVDEDQAQHLPEPEEE